MSEGTPNRLGLIAGKGVYPRLLAESAKRQGVERLFAVAFKGETDRRIEGPADEVTWIHLGQLGRMLESLKRSGVTRAVMAGQLTPTHLFRVRMDREMLSLLKSLSIRNAETIFGAVADRLAARGIRLMPASAFMEDHMPEEGLLSVRAPSERETADIRLGLDVARTTSALDIGQTVVIREGTVLAVEAFEGTDATIRRAGRLAKGGLVVVKVAKPGHDMRFDIPVIGMHTMRVLRRSGAVALAMEAGRAILLERDRIVETANEMKLAMVAVAPGPDTKEAE